MCLCWLLKSQDQSAWSKDKTLQCFYTILSFVNHSKPKIRKCGQEAIRLVINSFSTTTHTDTYEYITSATAEFCLQSISKDGESGSAEAKKDEQRENIFHILNLIKYTVHHFHIKDLKRIGECLLRLMTLKDIVYGLS
jgi:ribosomal RNA-processing protein 12